MHPRPLSRFPENDWTGDTPLEAAKLLEEGYLDTSHLLDVRQYTQLRKAGYTQLCKTGDREPPNDPFTILLVGCQG